jgi:hypothetical protein
MSRTIRGKSSKQRQRRLSVRAVRRSNPDPKRLSRALITYALEQAATEAAAESEQERKEPPA